jgi:hypothetical protein
MNSANVPRLTPNAENRTWYRAVDSRFLTSAIATKHTIAVPSRFYDPFSASPQFSTLYVLDNSLVALFEIQALFGSPTTPGGVVPAPTGAWTTLTVRVRLRRVVDLTDLASQALLDINVQELTGDWRGYAQRSSRTNVTVPVGTAPTQYLGEAIFRDSRNLEGFLTVSAKVPYHRNLIAFPAHFRSRSYIAYDWRDTGGNHTYRVDQANPEGKQVR